MMTSCIDPTCYTSSYSVLRLAGDDEGMIRLLHRSLMERFASPGLSSPHPSMLHITNQYFEAHVMIEKITSPFTTTSAITSKDYAHTSVSGDESAINQKAEDGIALIFFSHGNKDEISQAFDSLSHHHQHAECNSQCGDLLRLCIGILSHDLMDATTSSEEDDDVKTKDEEFTRRVMWCLDHGYEYVEADLTDLGRSIGHDERDKDGFARIVEAVGNTVWSTAKMHPRKAQLLRSAYSADKNIARSLPSSAISKTEPDERIETNEITTGAQEVKGTGNDVQLPTPVAKPLSPPTQSTLRSIKIFDSEADSKVESLLADETEFEDEAKLESLEFLIKEASRIRDFAKRKELSDDERRRQAGDMAMRLISALGNDLFGSDSEDEATDDKTDPA